MNKPPADVPEPSAWHHGYASPLEKTRVVKEENFYVRRAQHGIGPPLLKAFANGDLGTLDELLASDFVNHNPLPGQDPGRESYMRTVAEKHAAFSDIRHTIDYQTTNSEMVITRHTTHRIHDRGASLGIEPTGREWNFTHIDIHRIVGGKVLEEWSARRSASHRSWRCV